MATCQAVSQRHRSLSQQVDQTTDLLSTRVSMIRERQNQAVLESLARRAKLQLRLQQTVEGLSVAATTYYIVGLVGYATRGLASVGVAVNSHIAMAVRIPIVALLVAFGVRKIRKMVTRTDKKPLIQGPKSTPETLRAAQCVYRGAGGNPAIS